MHHYRFVRTTFLAVTLVGCPATPTVDPSSDPSLDPSPPPDPPSPSIVPASCGDGIVDSDEECDDGPANADDGACTSTCVAASCGDGLLWAGMEDCEPDDPATMADCDRGCQLALRASLDVAHKMLGEGDFTYTGTGVAIAGDVNGDGFDDLIVGAHADDNAGGSQAGAAYLIHGPATDVSSLENAQAKLTGESKGDGAGIGVSGAGDVNGDGFDDLIVGAWNFGPGPDGYGAAYLMYGPVQGTVSLANADAKLVGEPGASYPWGLVLTGEHVDSAGDVDGDGFGDILIGASQDDSTQIDAGAVYLMYGPVSGTYTLAAADAKLVGTQTHDLAGEGLAGGGDIDGDGLSDLLVGAPGNDDWGLDTGAAYLLYGTLAGVVSLSNADGEIHGTVVAEPAHHHGGPYTGNGGDRLGEVVAMVGDVDGDGLHDVVVNAAGQDDHAAYLFVDAVDSVVSKDEAVAVVRGQSWFSSMSGGDVDGDGISDLVLGQASYDDVEFGVGAVSMLHGPIVGQVSLDHADATWLGEGRYDNAGESVDAAGDVDGDGRSDILIGAPGHDGPGNTIGAAYLIFGW